MTAPTEHSWLVMQGQRGGLMRQLKSKNVYPLISVGGGPWRVLAECEAPRHNTARAARGASAAGIARCICPVARALHDRYRAQENAAKEARRAGATMAEVRKKRDVLSSMKVAAYFHNIAGLKQMPDLRGGNCQDDHGRAAMDRASASSHDQEGVGAIAAAKLVCRGCPVKELCGGWALAEEKPAGAWGAVYGGMSVVDRRAARSTIAKMAKQEGARS